MSVPVGAWCVATSRLALQTRPLAAPRENHRKQVIELNDEQVRLLERFSPEFRERQIEVHYTGVLMAVDTFFVGALKGVGNVYLQTVLDCYSRHAWGLLYTSKLPITSVHVLNETVLPFFEAHEARVYTILSDNGHEFCGRPDHHPYELFLQLEGGALDNQGAQAAEQRLYRATASHTAA